MQVDRDQAREYLEAYGEYARTLRTWLVAFGAGAPLIMLGNDDIGAKVQGSGNLVWIAGMFVLGATAQALLAAVNKAAMWTLYYGETNPSFKDNWKYSAAHVFSERLWIDVLVDAFTMLVFAAGTVWVFYVVASSGAVG